MIPKISRLLIGTLAGMTIATDAAVVGSNEGGTIDLTRPDNYGNQPVPGYITRDNTPPGNQITDLGASLGRVLFYDKRLSKNDTVS
ncbi:MAG: hypothetical protein WBG04_10970, partial [Haloferula sp.]